MPQRRPVYFQQLDLGMNTRDPARRLARGAAQNAQNIDLSGGTVKKRPGTLRRGTSELNSGAVVQALHEFNHLANGTTRFAQAGTLFYSLDGSFDGTSLGQTAVATRHASVAAARDFLVIANRGSATAGFNWIWDGTGGGGIGKILGTAPVAGATAVENDGGGNLSAGVYNYKYSYYSNTYGFESAASAAVTSLAVDANDQMDIDFPAGVVSTLNTIWDKLRVYRTVAGGSTYYYHSDQTDDFTDSTADATVLGNDVFVDNLAATPPPCNFAVHFHDRVWLAGAATTNGSKVYVSEVGLPGDFKAASVAQMEDRRPITGMHEFADMLFVGTDRSVSVVRDITRAFGDLIFRNRSVEYGFASHFAIEEIESRLWFLDPQRGVCRMDAAGNVEEVSREILTDLTTALEPTELHQAYMGHNVRLKQLWLSVTLDAGTTNTRVYVCQYDKWHDSAYGPQPTWTYYDLTAGCFALMTGSDNNENLHFGDNAGYLLETNRAVRQDDTTADQASGTADTQGAADNTTLVDSTATWPTAGNGLDSAEVLVYDTSGEVWEVATITANTGTTLTFAALGFRTAVGDTYRIGPIDAIWKSGSDQLDQPMEQKKAAEIVFTHKTETHTDSVEVGRYLDEASTVTVLVSQQRLDDAQNLSPNGRKRIGDGAYGEGYAVQFRARGSQDDFEILDVAVVVDGQLPRH